MQDYASSQHRACVLIGVVPKTVRREHPPDNPEIRLEMNKIAEKRRWFGHPLAVNRRIGVLLERLGMVMNEKKPYRIHRPPQKHRDPWAKRKRLSATTI